MPMSNILTMICRMKRITYGDKETDHASFIQIKLMYITGKNKGKVK